MTKNIKINIVKNTTFYLCLTILFSNSCKKDCHEKGTCPPDYRTFPLGEAKNYLWSLKGSYWIYKNTATGELDTQTCTGFICDTVIRKGTRNDTKHITVEFERIMRTIESSFDKWEYYDETGGYNPNAIRPLKAIVDRSASGPNYIEAFFLPFVLGDHEGNGISITTFKEMDSTLIIQGKTYLNVAKFDIDIDYIWESGAPHTGSNYYWAKDVGLIKRFGKTYNFSWELIEYNIIK